MSPLQRNNRSEKQRSSCKERCTWHVSPLKAEEEYVRRRYRAVVRTVLEDAVLRIPRAQAAPMIGRSRRQLQRMVRRFLEEGIPGLRLGSRRPHTSPRTHREEDRRGQEGDGLRLLPDSPHSQRRPLTGGQHQAHHGHHVLQHTRQEPSGGGWPGSTGRSNGAARTSWSSPT